MAARRIFQCQVVRLDHKTAYDHRFDQGSAHIPRGALTHYKNFT